MKEYPTEKQLKYINDYMESIYSLVNYILDTEYEVQYTEKFHSIESNDDVNQIINYMRLTQVYLYDIYQSIKHKRIESFRHLLTKDNFLKKETVLKTNYLQLENYCVLPKYDELREEILRKIKQ